MRWSIPTTMGRLAMLSGLALAPAIAQAQSVVTYHNAPDRSGAYTVPYLTYAAAATLHKDTAFQAAISGNVYAQPLYWQRSGGKVGLLIVATESDLVYALNANTGAVVWKTQVGTPVQSNMLPCGDISPEGVTGTPVIDPASGRLYLNASTLQTGNVPRHMIYALSLATGKIVANWPLNVDTAMAARKATFSSELQGERSALQFFDGKLYITYGGRSGDCDNYHGTVVEVTPSTVPKITGDWATRASKGGIWSQGGAVSDGSSLFVTTGNTSGATSWGDGEAVIRLLPGLAHSANIKDYFTPGDWQTLDQNDYDLGGTAAIPIKVATTPSQPQSRLIGFGKDGHAYLLNGSSLGGIGHALENKLVSNSRIITAPAVYQGPLNALVVFTNLAGLSSSCSGESLTMLKVTDSKAPISTAWCAPLNGGGAPIVTNTTDGKNPIVWVTGAEGDNEIHGFNATTGKVVFSGANTGMNGLRHFGTLIAANGHLYVAADNTVYAFGF